MSKDKFPKGVTEDSPDYLMKLIYDAIMKHDETKKTKCYDNYGCPSYVR